MTIEMMPKIDWDTFPESDGEPMAETQANAIQMVDLIFALTTLVTNQGRSAHTAVGGNQLMYYNRDNGRDHIAPDVYVILDYPPPPPSSWRVWEHGKFPEIVFEISSPSTTDIDVSETEGEGKRWRYGMLEVREYYIYDPQGELDPRLQGFVLNGKRLERMATEPDGSIYSPLLGAELRQVGEFLRVIDPATGFPLLTPDETRERLTNTEGRLVTTQERLSDAEGRLSDAEARLGDERRTRQAVEERAAYTEEALRQALARLGEQRPPT